MNCSQDVSHARNQINQRWREGLNEVQVMTASRVRIVIRPNGTNDDEEITFASGLRSLRIGECVRRPG